MVDPATRIVTATITEKGYCLNKEGGLDFSHPDIAHDLQNPTAPRTFVGFLARALRMRRDHRSSKPFNVISCDNLADNGHRLRRAVLEFVRSSDPTLAPWIEAEVPFPCTMVDSITPATDDALRARVEETLGVEDRWPVQREFFCQWVIENKLRGPTTGLGRCWRHRDRRCRRLRTRQTAPVERRALHARLRRQSRRL